MMSLLQVTGPLGIVSGYILTSLLLKAEISWNISFVIQAILHAVCAFALLFTSNIYYSSTLHCLNPKQEEEKQVNEKSDKSQELDRISNKSSSIKKQDDEISIFGHKSKEDFDEAKNFWKNLCQLVKIRVRKKYYFLYKFIIILFTKFNFYQVYMLCTAAYFSLMFISTIIQYWTSDYLKEVIKADSSMVIIAFVVTCITAPTLGIVAGGCIVQKFGGYESKNALNILSIFAILAVICAIPITQFDSLPGFASFLWLFLFFGGCIVPNLYGVTISAVPVELRAAASSSTNFFNSVFGFSPAPYFYGALYDSTKNESPKFAYGCSLIYSITVLVLILLANFFYRKDFKIISNEKEEIHVAVEQTEKNNKLQNHEFINQQDISSNKNHSEIPIQKNSQKAVNISEINIDFNHESIIKDKVNKYKIGEEENLKNTSSNPYIAKFNSDGGINRMKSTNLNLPEYIKSEDLIFKGENGNQEVFEIKFDKLNTKDNEILYNQERPFMSARLEQKSNIKFN
jgi:MFS family permease